MTDISPYNTITRCPKCQSFKYSKSYQADRGYPTITATREEVRRFLEPLPEHLKVTCGVCGYFWLEYTADFVEPTGDEVFRVNGEARPTTPLTRGQMVGFIEDMLFVRPEAATSHLDEGEGT
jgi:predicted nucleic-acid-binding Zn-ribbon protein